MRSSASPFTSPSGLVDKRLQPMWEQIEQVRALLPQIAHVSYYIESLFNLDRNLSLLADENVDHHILKDITIFQGASAYELALVGGFVGSQVAWLASLKGDQGESGVADDATLLQIQTDIQTNTADILALTALTNTLSSYTPLSTYNARVTSVNSSLASLQASVAALESAAAPVIPTNLQITTLAQGVYDASIPAVLNSLGLLDGRIDTANDLIAQLDTERIASDLAFSEFLLANNTTLTRVTALEASSTNQSASIVSLQSVTATAAADILVLEAEGLTSAAQIVDLYSVTSDAATAINTLQVANNANNASITAMSAAYIAADAAAALDRLDIRADFAAADSAVASAAAALVSTEATARSTADAAAATDRALIRTQFAAADTAVLTSATALVTSEATARSTADSAAATDRAAIRAEFASADAGVASTAAALVSAESSARATAVGAVASSVTSLTTTVNGHTSTLSTQATTIAGIDGRVAAKYNLTLDVGGRVSGFTSENDGNVARFEVLANIFKIISPGGGARTEYSDGNWRVYDSSGTLRVRLGIW